MFRDAQHRFLLVLLPVDVLDDLPRALLLPLRPLHLAARPNVGAVTPVRLVVHVAGHRCLVDAAVQVAGGVGYAGHRVNAVVPQLRRVHALKILVFGSIFNIDNYRAGFPKMFSKGPVKRNQKRFHKKLA